MLVNDIKKGTWGVLKYTGWEFQVMDNKKGITRVLDVYGWAHEMGSTYVSDIAYIYPESKGMNYEEYMRALHGDGPALTGFIPTAVELSAAQAKQSETIRAFGF